MSGDEIEVEDRTGWSARELWLAPFGEADRRLMSDVPPEAIIDHRDGWYTLDLDMLEAAGWVLTDDGGLLPPEDADQSSP